jgi:long-chain acyl-CoA synthetase
MEEASNGKKFEKLTYASEFEFWTFQQLYDSITNLGAGLVAKTGLKPGDKVLIFAETQRDWMVAALAIFRQGGIVVTAYASVVRPVCVFLLCGQVCDGRYATLGEEGVVTSLNQTEATTCVCDAKLFKTLAASAPHCPTLKHVVTIIAEGASSLDGHAAWRAAHSVDRVRSRMRAPAHARHRRHRRHARGRRR